MEAIRLYREEERDIEKWIREREKDSQRQMTEAKIREAKYNKRYENFGMRRERPRYLLRENIDKIGREQILDKRGM